MNLANKQNNVISFTPTSSELRGSLISGLSIIPADWALTPVIDKAPMRSGWQTEAPIDRNRLTESLMYGDELPSSKGGKWKAWWNGYGIRTGSVSGGLLAIDCDGPSAKRVLTALGPYTSTVSWTSGKPGRAQLLYQLPRDLQKRMDAVNFSNVSVDEYDGVTATVGEELGFRYNGACSTLPPSYHPDTKEPYRWIISPEGHTVSDAPKWLVQFLTDKCDEIELDTLAKKATLNHEAKAKGGSWDDVEWAKHYLRNINPSTFDWQSWSKCVFAAHTAGVDEDTVRAWSDNYKSPEKFDITWPYIKERVSGKRVSIGTLNYFAKQQGWSAVKAIEDGFVPSEKAKDDYEVSFAELIAEVREANEHKDVDYRDFVLFDKLVKKHNTTRKRIEEILRRIQKDEGILQKTSFSAKEFCNLEEDGIGWLIPGFVPSSTMIMLSAIAKDGKSTLVYDLLTALIHKRPFLGEKPTKRCKVLLIQTEENASVLKKNLDTIGLFDESCVLDDDLLRVELSWDINRLDILEGWISSYKPDFIIFDSLRSISGNNAGESANENNAQFAVPLGNLKSKLNTFGLPSLIIHHNNKSTESKLNNKSAGSGSIVSKPDILWQYGRLSDDIHDPKRLLTISGRLSASVSYNIEYTHDEYDRPTFRNNGDVSASSEEKTLRKRVTDVLEANYTTCPAGLTHTDLANLLGLEKGHKYLYKVLDFLVSAKIVSKTKMPSNAKVRLYKLSQTPESSTQSQNETHNESALTSNYMDMPRVSENRPYIDKASNINTSSFSPNISPNPLYGEENVHPSINTYENQKPLQQVDFNGVSPKKMVFTQEGKIHVERIVQSHGSSAIGPDGQYRRDVSPHTRDRPPSLVPNPAYITSSVTSGFPEVVTKTEPIIHKDYSQVGASTTAGEWVSF
ncbi:MAG: bifunctional DNA primase/polymerase [Nodosilinea sp. WJT8-NPBG4]|jgi:hypothetical protein|nr:bifunctional DNA primase/polymerase [Nodosilinea sp. WJT8-NPBG4]